MEKLLVTNNGESNWTKLSVFGLHSRGSHIGFNKYAGKNSACVSLIDHGTGMRLELCPAMPPKSERVTFRGRPAKQGPVQFKEPGKRGRPAMFGPVFYRAGKPGRPSFVGPREELIFAGPLRKRGPKASIKVEGEIKAVSTGAKRGRMSEAARIKAAKPGEIVKSKNGSWLILDCGIPTWIAA